MLNQRSCAPRAVAVLTCLWPAGRTATAGGGSGRRASPPAPAARRRRRDRRVAARFAKVFDDYFEASLVLNPVRATSIGDNRYNDRFEVYIGPDWLARAEKLARDSLARARDHRSQRSSGAGPAVLRHLQVGARRARSRVISIPDQLLPFNQFDSTPNDFVQLGSGDGLQPFKTVKDYDDFLKRIDGFVGLDRPGDRQHARGRREGLYACRGC